MDENFLRYAVSSAKAAFDAGCVITADTHLRHALGCANRLKRRDVVAAVMRSRNRIRPAVMARRLAVA